MKRHLLSILDLSSSEIDAFLDRARELKVSRASRTYRPLVGRTLGLLFEKASTRTRVAFEVAMSELGGTSVYLSPEATQIGRGEPIRDTARVLGGYCDAMVVRTYAHERLEEYARYSPIPVINGLTDREHPCQVLTDLFTVRERLGDPRALLYAWIGDGNNMAHSWIHLARTYGLDLTLACPRGYAPKAAGLGDRGGPGITFADSPADAIRGRHVVSTDVWTSMGLEAEREQRQAAFRGFCIDRSLLDKAAPGAIVLHCLPANRGEEISDEVLEGTQSAAWQQAENRLHIHKAMLERILGTGAVDAT